MKIKKNYKKIVQEKWFNPWRKVFEDRYSDDSIGKYSHKYAYDRNVRTFNERKANVHAEDDGIKVRGRRKLIPNSWDDPHLARSYGRSWKDYTKRKKQWDK